MSENEKRLLVPRLRFPEFRDAKPWTFQPLGKLARRSTRKNSNSEITRVLTNSAEYGVIDQRDYFDKDIANQGNLEGYCVVEEGSYVYNPRISATAPVGPISKNRTGLGVMSPLYTVFQFNNCKDDFYAHYFKSMHWHQYMRRASSTGARHDRMSITNDDFMRLPLPVSSPEEQQKITDCLSSLDQLIMAELRKLDALKSHKNGLLQQIFPGEGETLPKLRFPEFRDAGEWELIRMGTLLARNPEYGLNAPAVPYSDNLPTYLRITDIDDDGRFLYESKVSVDVVVANDNYLELGDIVLARTGASVGKSYRYREEDGKLVFAGFLIRVRPVANKVNPVFLSSFLATQRYWDWVRVTSTRSGQPGINGAEYASLLIPMPPSTSSDFGMAEQTIIAEFLSSIDELITAQGKKIELLKMHKTGLMQQLFPVLDEASA
ncbi:restriction endonuclease subunit S [Pseudomonas aeruginosa]|uniref:restriction endonuclease subunit S n=1 Tax=Pseudomonas aeruginosa TaxID=287 RepID=UPI0012DA25D1|nr:restriction endonuclease subunit S [Pseudomonas aeruginosa]MUJ01935.1 restriction endonuclease subunit S [Pseudomonas aeruginosa]